ncbi:hypothetical protein L2E82_30237 [Cichorium intybus]|uniref:Uncharacterized protein n=1 Tax=Cichorium intybus TaxID=13427 RepID=A0ACB9D016_CICIN|nr:hypothetical protein L2E82_30237 [Cichorium intybus]
MADEVKLYAVAGSPFVCRAKIALNIKGIKYENLEKDLHNNKLMPFLGFRVQYLTAGDFKGTWMIKLCYEVAFRIRIKAWYGFGSALEEANKVLTMEDFEYLYFMIFSGEKGSEKILLSQNAPFFANSDTDMLPAPVHASQVVNSFIQPSGAYYENVKTERPSTSTYKSLYPTADNSYDFYEIKL